MLRFVVLPAVLMLAAVWLLVLHKLSTLLPFLSVVAVVLLILKLVGMEPLAFFVSFGGYVWFVVLAWIAAAVVRDVGAAIRRHRLRR